MEQSIEKTKENNMSESNFKKEVLKLFLAILLLISIGVPWFIYQIEKSSRSNQLNIEVFKKVGDNYEKKCDGLVIINDKRKLMMRQSCYLSGDNYIKSRSGKKIELLHKNATNSDFYGFVEVEI